MDKIYLVGYINTEYDDDISTQCKMFTNKELAKKYSDYGGGYLYEFDICNKDCSKIDFVDIRYSFYREKYTESYKFEEKVTNTLDRLKDDCFGAIDSGLYDYGGSLNIQVLIDDTTDLNILKIKYKDLFQKLSRQMIEWEKELKLITELKEIDIYHEIESRIKKLDIDNLITNGYEVETVDFSKEFVTIGERKTKREKVNIDLNELIKLKEEEKDVNFQVHISILSKFGSLPEIINVVDLGIQDNKVIYEFTNLIINEFDTYYSIDDGNVKAKIKKRTYSDINHMDFNTIVLYDDEFELDGDKLYLVATPVLYDDIIDGEKYKSEKRVMAKNKKEAMKRYNYEYNTYDCKVLSKIKENEYLEYDLMEVTDKVFLVAQMFGGFMEDPGIRYEHERKVRAKTEEEAIQKYKQRVGTYSVQIRRRRTSGARPSAVTHRTSPVSVAATRHCSTT